MAKSLQEQLMGSGLVDKSKAKKIQKEKRKKRKQTPKNELLKEEQQKIELAEKQKQEKAEKDRELNRIKKAEQDKKAVKAQIIQLIQTNKIYSMPLVLFGSKYWQGLLDWIKSQPLHEGLISPQDMDLLHLTDDIDEVVDIMVKHRSYKEEKITQAKCKK